MRLFFFLVALSILVHAAAAAPGKGAKKKGGPGANKAAGAMPRTNAENPADALSPFIEHLDALLALEQKPKAPPIVAQASGRLVTLRSKFAAEREQAAETEKVKYDAAIATCDTISGAIQERQQAAGDIKTSQAMATSSKLEKGPRKDNLTQGIDGNGRAKAAGARVELKREQAANRQARRSASETDAFMDAAALNRWNKRSQELRQQIVAAYSRIPRA